MTCRCKTAIVFAAGALCVAAMATAATITALNERNGDTSQMNARTGREASPVNRIRLEHVALNVADPVKMAQWYVENLGMKIMREGPAPVNARFLADADGNMMLEVYHNPPEAVPNYASMDPLILHVAFQVDDVDAIRSKLLAAGATATDEVTVTSAGDKITMLRDPWGLAIQFLHRADPMLPQQ